MKYIIGLIGYSNSGKGEFYNIISKNYSIPTITSGDIVRREVLKMGLELNHESVAYVSDLVKEETGSMFTKVARDIKELFRDFNVLIIDSLRVEKDYHILRGFCDGLITIAILSETNNRYARMLERNRKGDPETLEEFIKLEDRERRLGVDKLILIADYFIENNGSLVEFRDKSVNLIKKIFDDYCNSNFFKK